MDEQRADGERRRAGLAASIRPAPSLPLATGDLSADDARELQDLKTLIQRRAGLACDGYKERCLRRRIAVRMRAHGLHRYREYAALLERDRAEVQRLLDAVMINVSKFFRNGEVWDRVRAEVVPWLFSLEVPRVRIWSAGSAGGEEAYSLAILLLEHAGAADLGKRFEIVGSDLDEGALAMSERGEYTAYALTETPVEVRDRWFENLGGSYRVKPEVRRLVRFERRDLIADDFPQDQHLIFCRNVIIYFERSVQERLFRQFREALVPGGYLVLGKVEALFGAPSAGYQTVASRERIFRRA